MFSIIVAKVEVAMTLHQLFGLIGLLLLGAVIYFAFRQATKVKPDPNNKMEGGLPQGSDPDGGVD
jgi:hypothetical protein